jgi:hypothetical protein
MEQKLGDKEMHIEPSPTPVLRLRSGAYVCNRPSVHLSGDPSSTLLC